MVELIATLVMTASSAALFVYWFRYTCILTLSAKTAHNYALQVAADHKLSFVTANTQLGTASGADLDRLCDVLDRDYAVITGLLDTSRMENCIEARLLSINYLLTRMWHKATVRFSASTSRKALEQMAATIEYFANCFGELAANASAA